MHLLELINLTIVRSNIEITLRYFLNSVSLNINLNLNGTIYMTKTFIIEINIILFIVNIFKSQKYIIIRAPNLHVCSANK